MNTTRVNVPATSRGFSLIELVVVVIIIGILAAIAVPRFMNVKDDAQVATLKSDLRNLITQQERYIQMNKAGTNPATYGTPAMDTTTKLVTLNDGDATAPKVLWQASPQVSLGTTAPTATKDGWSVQLNLGNKSCAYSTGTATAINIAGGDAGNSDGKIVCGPAA